MSHMIKIEFLIFPKESLNCNFKLLGNLKNYSVMVASIWKPKLYKLYVEFKNESLAV